jgi:glycerophosphoryl diester phosphodiesterase
MLTLSKKKYSVLLIAVLIAGCLNGEHHRKSDSGITIRNIGHAGSGFNYLMMPFNPYPTNSFQSLKNAIDNGADGVEVDLQLTADHELVLFHDNTLESHTELKGFIIQADSRAILNADYECGFPYDWFQDEKVISLSRWLDYAKQLQTVPYLQIDIKTANSEAEALADTMMYILYEKLIAAGYPLEKVILISGDHNLLSKTINDYPMFNCAYQPAEFYTGLKWVTENKCKYIIIDQKYLTAAEINDAHSKGIRVIAMGGRSESKLASLIEMNPDFIQANNVKALHELLH